MNHMKSEMHAPRIMGRIHPLYPMAFAVPKETKKLARI